MKIKDISEEYLSELKTLKRYSSNTITAYKNDLAKFFEFCTLRKISGFTRISQTVLRSYLAFLAEQNLDKRSISRNLSALRGLFQYSFRKGYTDSNYAAFLPSPKVKKNLPEIASLDFLSSIYNSLRNGLLISIIFNLLEKFSFNSSEICSLNRTDFNLDNRTLRVQMGDEFKIIPIDLDTVQLIIKFFQWREDSNEALFVQESGKRIHSKFITTLEKRISKAKKKPDETVSLDSILEIYNIAGNSGKNTLLIKAIFEILYGCALRVSELCNLDRLDIDLDKCTLRVTGKGNKVRIVPVGSKSLPVIKEYLQSRKDSNKALLVNDKAERIYPKSVYRIVNLYLSKVTDISKRSPHILRHSAATHMLDRGADLNTVKEILGHENLSTTQIYTHVSVERLKRAYKKAHPKS